MPKKLPNYLFVLTLIWLLPACDGPPAPVAPSPQPPTEVVQPTPPPTKAVQPTPSPTERVQSTTTTPPTVSTTVPVPTPTEPAAPATDLPAELVFIPDPGIRVRLATEPNAAVAEDGTVYLFYNDKSENTIGQRVVAEAADGLNFDAPTPIRNDQSHPYDPWRVQLPDGTWRKYRFDIENQNVISLSSDDGIQFQPDDGVRFPLSESDNGTFGIHDEYVDNAGGVVMLYIGDMGGVNNVRLAYSPPGDNGLNFTLEDADPLGDAAAGGGKNSFVDPRTTLLPDGRRRLILMWQGEGPAPPLRAQGTIVSFITEDGHKFTQEPGVRLSYDDFTEFEVVSLNDPVVVPLADGRYRMYVAALIKIGSDEYEWGIVSATTPGSNDQ
ncbi:MAG: hypothetical protein ACE5FD_14620 [Anaerolineae bacterium]